MMFRSNNLAARLFERQILTPRPGTSVNLVRLFYENLVPSCTICDVDCPDHWFRKFTDDGQYLVSYSRNCQDLIVYRSTWFSFSCKEDCDSHCLPQKAKRFDSFFTQLYCVSLASTNERICRDFFLYVQSHQFGLFGTYTAQRNDASTTEGAINGVPSIEKITIYLVRLEDGVILDEKAFCNDFVVGPVLYDDLLCIMSLQYQTIHVLQIRNSGGLLEVRNIGIFCREDDELFLNTHAQESMQYTDHAILGQYLHTPTQEERRALDRYLKYAQLGVICENLHRIDVTVLTHQQHIIAKNSGVHSAFNTLAYSSYLNSLFKPFISRYKVTQGSYFLSGIKQRLLSFVFRRIWNEEADPTLRVQHLKKFYFQFQDFVDLIMWKVQFLDRHHLLIRFGSDSIVAQSTDQHPTFFAVYNIETTEIVACYQGSSEELYSLLDQFYDHFRGHSRNSLHANFISSHCNNIHALDQFWCLKNNANSISQFTMAIASLPLSCQIHSPSPYLDFSLFRYDRKLIPAFCYRPYTEHPFEFISRRQPNVLKFKIKSGPEAGVSDGRPNRSSLFLFHPYLPLALSIQRANMQPTVVNIHFRR